MITCKLCCGLINLDSEPCVLRCKKNSYITPYYVRKRFWVTWESFTIFDKFAQGTVYIAAPDAISTSKVRELVINSFYVGYQNIVLGWSKKKCLHLCSGREFTFHNFLDPLHYRFWIQQSKCLVVTVESERTKVVNHSISHRIHLAWLTFTLKNLQVEVDYYQVRQSIM